MARLNFDSKERGTYSGRVRRSFSVRYLAVGVLFAAILLVFTARLASLQLSENDTYFTYNEDNTSSFLVPIPASRGAICDVNGKELVRDSTACDLVFDYEAMPADNAGINGMILHAREALRISGNEARRTETVFPFVGMYPDYTPSAALSDPESTVTVRLRKFMKNRGLPQTADLQTVLQKMLSKYGLIDRRGELVYDAGTTHYLLTVRFDMEGRNFSAAAPYTVATEVDLYLVTYLEESPYDGIKLQQKGDREYVYPGYASHILGRTGKIYAEEWASYRERGYEMDDMVGISGCEAAFEEYLRGRDGTMRVTVDSRGNIVRMEVVKAPQRGRDVWLTIDIDLQIAAEDALRENVGKIVSSATAEHTGEDCNAGAVVALDPKTGAVRVLASYPTYELSAYNRNYAALSSDPDLPLINRALEGTYAPGSTFKLGVSIAALEEGIITPSTLIHTEGIYRYYAGYQPRCWYYTNTGLSHGDINVVSAIQVSCNYFFYEVGRLLTIDRIDRYASLFGLGQKTGIELPESTGILAGPEYRDTYGLAEWKETDTLAAAIGQSNHLFTPIQICQYTAAITNGGTRWQTHLLSRVAEYGAPRDAEPLVSERTEILGQFTLQETTVQAVKQGMKQVISSSASSAAQFRGIGVSVGGKTGTAQVGTERSDNGVFTCVAPLEDPEIAVTVVIERAGGGSNVVPTAGAVVRAYFAKKPVG